MNFFFIIAFAICCSAVYAQNNQKIDEIKKNLAVATTDSAVVELTTDLAFEISDVDRHLALDYFLRAEKLSKKAGYQKGLLSVYLGEGALMDDAAEFDSAMFYYTKGLSLAKKMNDLRWQSSFHINTGLIYLRQNKHPEAMAEYNLAQALSEQAGDEKGVANILRKKANLVLQDLDYKTARSFYRQSVEVYERVKDSGKLGETLGSLGFEFSNEKIYDSAIFYFNKANQVFIALRYNNMIAVAYTEIGKALYGQGKYNEALQNFTAADRIYDTVHYMAHQDALNVFLGDTWLQLNDVNKAETHYKKALQLATESKDMDQQSSALYGLFEVNEKNGQLNKAIAYLKNYDSLKDEIANRKQLAKVTEMTNKYEAEKKQKEINKQQYLLAQKNYWLAASVGLLVVFVLLGLGYYKRFRLKKEKQLQQEIMHQQDLATRSILRAEENERERIARELHDGVGQMMSAAKMNLSAFQQDIDFRDRQRIETYEKIVAMVDESCKEIRMVSHQMMPNSLLKKGLGNAIREFINQIDNRILKIDLYTEGLNEPLDSNIETVLYRVVQECVNNVIKHSGANHLDISLIKDMDGIGITIEDNGKGFDVQKTSDGIGLLNIKSRIAFLKGTVEFNSSPANGTLVAISVPIEKQTVA